MHVYVCVYIRNTQFIAHLPRPVIKGRNNKSEHCTFNGIQQVNKVNKWLILIRGILTATADSNKLQPGPPGVKTLTWVYIPEVFWGLITALRCFTRAGSL